MDPTLMERLSRQSPRRVLLYIRIRYATRRRTVSFKSIQLSPYESLQIPPKLENSSVDLRSMYKLRILEITKIKIQVSPKSQITGSFF
jgi:hypothetical protein